MAQEHKDEKKEESKQFWEGKVSAELQNITADEAWKLLGDFFSLNRWLPTIHTCKKVNDADGHVVRYCASGEEEECRWAKEKLVSLDQVNRSCMYSIVENNMGFKNHVACIKVSPQYSGAGGCRIEWSFETEPVDGWSREGLVSYFEAAVEQVANRVEQVALLVKE